MTRLRWVLAVLTAAALVSSVPAAVDDPTSIEDVMNKGSKKEVGLRDQITKEVKKPSPDWATVQAKAKEWTVLAAALGKNDPPKGDKASWKRFTDTYVA